MKSSTQSHKIFVEPDEEIVFTIEKILAAPSERVIVVVPQHAMLTSSAVSLKLLARQISKTDKFIVVVSDSEIGKNLGTKANLVVVSKISEVSKEVWQQVKELKMSWLEKRAQTKHELLEQRKESEIKEESSDTEVKVVPQPAVKAQIIEESKQESAEIEDLKIINKPRLQDKVVELGGVLLVSGGDVMDHLNEIEIYQTAPQNPDPSGEHLIESAKKTEVIKTVPNEPGEEEFALTGKDFTQIETESPVKKSIPSRLDRLKKKDWWTEVNQKIRPIIEKLTSGSNASRNAKIAGVVIVVFFLVSYIFLPTVTVSLEYSEDEVNVNETVIAKTGITSVDKTTLSIPAIKVSKSSSASKDATATGKGETGDLAKGIVDISNKKSQSITLAKGTVLTNISSQLNYKITQDVTIPKESGVVDIPIEAESYGEKYNIKDVNSTFKVNGYSTDEVIAFGFLDIEGGTTREVVQISQEDYDKLKGELTEELKADLLETLQTLVSDNDILLTGSEKFAEVSVSSSANVGDEAQQFSMDLEMSITALKVVKGDLRTIAEEIVKIKQQSGEDAEVNVDDPTINNVIIDGEQATFQLASKANVLENIDTDEIRNAIKGKSVGDARSYLEGLEQLDAFTLKYRPSYIPRFLQKVPSNPEKIKIEKVSEK